VTQVSIIAKQVGNELRPFGTQAGVHIAFVHEGKRTHMEIFTTEHSAMAMHSYLNRCACWGCMLFGSFLVLKAMFQTCT